MEPTLEEALAKVFGGPAPPPSAQRVEQPALPREALVVGEARDHYREALEKLRVGDWAAFWTGDGSTRQGAGEVGAPLPLVAARWSWL